MKKFLVLAAMALFVVGSVVSGTMALYTTTATAQDTTHLKTFGLKLSGYPPCLDGSANMAFSIAPGTGDTQAVQVSTGNVPTEVNEDISFKLSTPANTNPTAPAGVQAVPTGFTVQYTTTNPLLPHANPVWTTITFDTQTGTVFTIPANNPINFGVIYFRTYWHDDNTANPAQTPYQGNNYAATLTVTATQSANNPAL